MRHGGNFKNWWFQERSSTGHVFVSQYEGVTVDDVPKIKCPLFNIVVYTKIETRSAEDYKLDFHKSLGGQAHVFCGCTENPFPLIVSGNNYVEKNIEVLDKDVVVDEVDNHDESNEVLDKNARSNEVDINLKRSRKSTKRLCMNNGCNAKEFYCCSHHGCKTRICKACFKECSESEKTVLQPHIEEKEAGPNSLHQQDKYVDRFFQKIDFRLTKDPYPFLGVFLLNG